jgi:hypothetical protein
MEEHAHLRWLFDTSSNTCSFGCEKGFFNAHSLLRHYQSGDCQGLSDGLSHSPTTEDLLVQSTLSHSQTLEIKHNLWSISPRYAPGFSSRELLCRLYNGGSGGHYVIFVYRDSSNTHRSKDKDPLLRHSRHFINYLRRFLRLHGQISSVTLRKSSVKSALMPHLGGDIGLEMQMSTSGLPLSRTSSASANHNSFLFCARHATLFTKLIGAHVIHALSEEMDVGVFAEKIGLLPRSHHRLYHYLPSHVQGLVTHVTIKMHNTLEKQDSIH